MMKAIDIDALLNLHPYSMWQPKSKLDLFLDFPDLRTVPALKLDSPKKLLFVWYYACRCSRAKELNEKRERITYAVKMAWGKRPPKDILEAYLEERWGKAVEEAISAMRTYEPEPRMIMKLMAGEQIIRIKQMMEDRTDEPKTWDEKLAYVKFTKAAFEQLRDLQPLTEPAALGITIKTGEQTHDEGMAMSEVDNHIGT